MEMIEVKTSELIGPALDWATAKASETKIDDSRGKELRIDIAPGFQSPWVPSVNWYQGGPLIEEHFVFVGPPNYDCKDYVASIPDPHDDEGCLVVFGQTHLIAACRAIVASVFGDTVSVPKELMQ